MRKNMLAIGQDSEPTEHGKKLFVEIQKIVDLLDIPKDWQFRRCFKSRSSGITEAGELLFKANSWVMEFYIDDNFYEQFAISDIGDLIKIRMAFDRLKKSTENRV